MSVNNVNQIWMKWSQCRKFESKTFLRNVHQIIFVFFPKVIFIYKFPAIGLMLKSEQKHAHFICCSNIFFGCIYELNYSTDICCSSWKYFNLIKHIFLPSSEKWHAKRNSWLAWADFDEHFGKSIFMQHAKYIQDTQKHSYE